MKIRLNSEMCFRDIEKYLYPVSEYGKEKIINNMYDDWNEYEHTKECLKSFINSIKKKEGDIVDIYYLEEENIIVGVIISLSGSDNIKTFLKEINVAPSGKRVAKLTCFHILKEYRGIGKNWLKREVLSDLKEQGIEEVYIKSSHNKALNLYDKLGTRIGNYIGISDNKLYQRYGYIYKIEL